MFSWYSFDCKCSVNSKLVSKSICASSHVNATILQAIDFFNDCIKIVLIVSCTFSLHFTTFYSLSAHFLHNIKFFHQQIVVTDPKPAIIVSSLKPTRPKSYTIDNLRNLYFSYNECKINNH